MTESIQDSVKLQNSSQYDLMTHKRSIPLLGSMGGE